MIASAYRHRHWAICLLAGGWLLANTTQVFGQRIGWSPSRDEAVVLESDAAIGTGIRPAAEFVEEIPAPRADCRFRDQAG